MEHLIKNRRNVSGRSWIMYWTYGNSCGTMSLTQSLVVQHIRALSSGFNPRLACHYRHRPVNCLGTYRWLPQPTATHGVADLQSKGYVNFIKLSFVFCVIFQFFPTTYDLKAFIAGMNRHLGLIFFVHGSDEMAHPKNILFEAIVTLLRPASNWTGRSLILWATVRSLIMTLNYFFKYHFDLQNLFTESPDILWLDWSLSD